MSDHILEIEGLSKRLGHFELKDVSFVIPKGYIMGFIGQNGSGKTTTLKCIMNLIERDSGSIRLFGEDNRNDLIKIRNRIGYVSEEPYFYEAMSVAWTGRFVGSFYEHHDAELFSRMLTQFQLDPNKRVKELSRGMKVKLSLALALAHRPELLILDEPTSGLDPVVRSELLDIFLEVIQNENCAVFFSSHISSDIEKIADYITIINDGRIVVSTDKHKLLDEWIIVKAESRCRHPQTDALMTGIKASEFGYSGIVKDMVSFRHKWSAIFPTASYKTERLTLDELLLRVVKEEKFECVN
ncbi:MAG: ABC transporter ATP-binding protein [Gorillibacterium sp.]|nr:ABC transporter ATP-binding protein [Gorillibacterium sp.]